MILEEMCMVRHMPNVKDRKIKQAFGIFFDSKSQTTVESESPFSAESRIIKGFEYVYF